MTVEKYTILLVEDDESLAMALTDSLEMHNYAVVRASDGSMALEQYRLHKPDLILLDVILPEKNGYEVAEAIRAQDLFTPILFMTGTEVEEKDRLRAYDIGACDYLIKPLLPTELIAKIRVWQSTRRIVANNSTKHYKIDGRHCSLDQESLTVEDARISLAGRERKVMELLLGKNGEIVCKQELLYAIWKNDLPENDQMLRNIIGQLRRKLSPLSLEIKQRYGLGYSVELSEK